jgi:4,5-DOPA dioxygenase extradiol
MTRLPTLFISHGSPLFALEPGLAGAHLAALGQQLPTPKAVLVVSPHWMTRQPRVATTAQPETMHDFGGFPAPLYQLHYPAAGHPALAERAIALLRQAGWDAEADATWGLDHGAWAPMLHMLPTAQVPVFQVSLPAALDGARAYAFGQALAPLREEGVLIVGSGSLTHNLRESFGTTPPDASAYVTAFADWVAQGVLRADHTSLKNTLALAPQAQRAHPTPEHFWPLLVAAGAAGTEETGRLLKGEITDGVLAMDSFVFGDTA